MTPTIVRWDESYRLIRLLNVDFSGSWIDVSQGKNLTTFEPCRAEINGSSSGGRVIEDAEAGLASLRKAIDLAKRMEEHPQWDRNVPTLKDLGL